jgi:hypothetical protein
MSLVTKFQNVLSSESALRGLNISQWRGGTRASANLLQISTVPQATVLYVKGSSNSPGFWGLTKNQLDRISESGTRWFCVFLHQSETVGYFLSGDQVIARIKDGDLTLAGDGDYKINQRTGLVGSQRFNSIQTLMLHIL